MFLRWKRQKVTRVRPCRRGDEFRDCDHGIPTERVTPQVLEAYRLDGKPKHRVVWTGPSFRMCCVDLPQRRVTWWRNVVTSIEGKVGSEGTTPAWVGVLDTIAELIPRPTADEERIYDEGYTGHTFMYANGETWDAFERRRWTEATENARTHKPKVKWTRVNFGGTPVAPAPTVDDPRTVLGLPPAFTADALRLAYRRAAKKHHPDKGGDPAEFRRVTEAYEKLRAGAT